MLFLTPTNSVKALNTILLNYLLKWKPKWNLKLGPRNCTEYLVPKMGNASNH